VPPRVVPERYELALAQGSVLDAGDIAEVSRIARDQQLTQDEAVMALRSYESALVEQSTKFRAELEADPTIGGAQLVHTQRDAQRALDTFSPASTPEGAALRQFLNKSGLTNSVHLVRLLAAAGRAMGEDRPIAQAPARGTTTPDLVELFYGKQT
jgi:hypothetical protein